MRSRLDYDRTILNHYNLATPFPTEWPAEKDDGDVSDDDRPAPASLTKANLQQKLMLARRSRFSVLDHGSHRRPSHVKTSNANRGNHDGAVMKDEADPLGMTDSVISVLRQKNLPIDEDFKLRNRFLLSSTTFSPSLFLAQVHANATTSMLRQGLDSLSKSIDQKSASLKVLVESNFERFVRAKATIDMVYNEMRNQGQEESADASSHSRNASRSSFHIRNGSGRMSDIQRNSAGPKSPSFGGGGTKAVLNMKQRNALTKENDYGINSIREPLLDAGVRVQDVWGPILGGRDREVNLKALLSTVENNSVVFELSTTIADCIKRRDHENLIEEFNKARRLRESAQNKARLADDARKQLTDEESREVLVIARMWTDVDAQINKYKQELWKRLVSTQNEQTSIVQLNSQRKEEYMDLISVLLELGVEDNPIWVWLLSRYDHLKNKMTTATERSRVEIEILRRRLANKSRPDKHTQVVFLRGPGQAQTQGKPELLDSFEVIELWEHIWSCLETLLSIDKGILGEIIEFSNVAQGFIDGKSQSSLPTGMDGQSQKHHRLSLDGVKQLQNGVMELVNLVRDQIYAIFTDAPPDDVSSLLSPATPMTPRENASFRDARFMLDPNSMPISPVNGHSWEKYAFWPPYSNSISGVHYLSKFLVLIANASSEMAALHPITKGSNTAERLKTFIAGTRERCVQVVCDAWSQDAENCKLMEDWQRSPKRPDETHMPTYFQSFEMAVLTGLQKMMYLSEAKAKTGTEDIITPPPTKLLQLVRTQFVGSLYKALSGMVENAETSHKRTQSGIGESLGIVSATSSFEAENMAMQIVDVSNKNVRRLLTLSNLQVLRSETVPQLLIHFETAFSVKLTDETKTIRDALSQIDARLFQNFVSSHTKTLSSAIAAGVSGSGWSPGSSKPADVSPYIYDTLLKLVLIHSEVSITASSLTTQILSYLLEQASQQMYEAFQKRPSPYSLYELMQATLDVEFLAVTMPAYLTEKASACHNQIYLHLDKSTTDDARSGLQRELPEVRSRLKALKEGTKAEFACFDRKRRKTRAGTTSTTNATDSTTSLASSSKPLIKSTLSQISI